MKAIATIGMVMGLLIPVQATLIGDFEYVGLPGGSAPEAS